jgi:hypothetical protein
MLYDDLSSLMVAEKELIVYLNELKRYVKTSTMPSRVGVVGQGLVLKLLNQIQIKLSVSTSNLLLHTGHVSCHSSQTDETG